MIPARLKKGDTIGIVAPSKRLSEDHKHFLEGFEKFADSLGLKVVLGKNIFSSDKFGVAAGTPQERADDINEMFKNPEIDAIWCFQGGEAANQTLDFLDYDFIKKNPKLFLGMSDIDLLHLVINKLTGLVCINSPDCKNGRELDMDFEYSQKSFKDRLFDSKKDVKPIKKWKTVRSGKAKGKLMGCNISSILKLAGTKYWPDFDNSVLFLEDYHSNSGEAMFKLEQLGQLGVFDKIKGIVVGYVHGFYENPQFDANGNEVNYEDVVLEATKDYDFPILRIHEFGHRCPNACIPIGAEVEIDADNQKITFTEDFVK